VRTRLRLLFSVLAIALALAVAAGCSSTPPAPSSASLTSATLAAAAVARPAATPTTVARPGLGATKKSKATHAAPVTIAFVNVGEGDGIVIKDGSWVGTIDGGKAGKVGAIAAELRHLGVGRLNVMLATHPDADHIGDLAALAQEFRPKIAYSDDVGKTKTYGRFIAALHAAHTKIVSVFRGHTLHLGALSAKVLNPVRDGSDTNADSIVLLLDIDGHRVLLTGDDCGATEDYVAGICARGPPLYLLKVAHHGSAHSTGASFLSETRPHYAVISVGPNSYGHPAPSTVLRLKAAHATVYTTQANGTVTVTFYASGAVHWSFGQSSKPFVG
jgi:competence protein ComEC